MVGDTLDLEFSGQLFTWRGPAPYTFVTVPPAASATIHAVAPIVTYGWGVIPVEVHLGSSVWSTSLFPKGGAYLVPIKASIRRAEGIVDGDTVSVSLAIRI